MKANLMLALLLAIAMNVSYGQWVKIETPTQNNLNAIGFYKQRIGFAVGENGTVLRSSNAGKTWQQMNFPAKENLTSVTIIDSGIVIVTGSSIENSPYVYRSEDAGVTWQKSLSDVKNFYATKTPLQKLFTVSDNIYRSVDAGRNWSYLKDLNNTSSYSFIGFADEKNGMVAGNISGAFTYSTEFVKTANGGEKWYNSYPYDFPNANGFSAMDFVNADTAFLITNFYNRFSPGDSCQVVMLSHFRLQPGLSDLEWHFKTKVLTVSFPDRLNACKFFNTGKAYTIGDKGIIYSSVNYGKRWKEEYSGKAILRGLYMFNENTGFVVGDGGLILRKESIAKEEIVKATIPVKVYPNPANDNVTVSFELNESSNLAIQVADDRGNIALLKSAKRFGKGKQQIGLNVSGLHKGVFQVNLISNGKVVASSKLVIVR